MLRIFYGLFFCFSQYIRTSNHMIDVTNLIFKKKHEEIRNEKDSNLKQWNTDCFFFKFKYNFKFTN